MAIEAVKEALECVNKAMQEGDAKYGVNAWLSPKTSSDKLNSIGSHIRGIERHTARRVHGEMTDRDSGLPALAHVAARALIALQLEIDLFRIRNEGDEDEEAIKDHGE